MADVGILRNVELFQGLDDERLEKIRAVGAVESYEEGATLFCCGEPQMQAFFVIEGRVGMYLRLQRETDQVPIHIAVPNQVIGEFALADDHPRNVDARALKPTKVFTLGGEDFHALATSDPWIGYVVMRNLAHILCKRTRKTQRELIASLSW